VLRLLVLVLWLLVTWTSGHADSQCFAFAENRLTILANGILGGVGQKKSCSRVSLLAARRCSRESTEMLSAPRPQKGPFSPTQSGIHHDYATQPFFHKQH
jgi:hypothetical protein